MDLPDSSEDVLAQPTRARIFELLTELKRPVSTGDIAGRLDLHANGVRRHLERLAEEGLIERRTERGGRGRPGDRWAVAPDASPGGERPTAYAELAVWLAEVMPDDPETVRRAEEVGRRIGRRLRTDPSRDAGESVSQAFRDAFAALGFKPRIEESGETGFTCGLLNCPYVESAVTNPRAVCGLHRGMTEGLLEQIDGDAELVGFEPRDPHEAGCLVKVK
ncbi:MAG: helix-turn-helix domain-containing protein [Solirubrobacterales bacterium]|nr:helix-turn-helix domain-containing protein [Solirubrobacterales bacterium]